jgi:hypothetical protein
MTCVRTFFNHSFVTKFQELVGELFFVSPKQLVKTGLASYNSLTANYCSSVLVFCRLS